MAKILIKDIMKAKKIKVNRIIPFVSVSRSTVYNILSGRKSPSIDLLEEFAGALNVSLEELYESEYSRGE